MRDHWDVIVIGAGIGGLTAATHLMEEGLELLVLERAKHPGGTAYTYHRKGCSFPMGPLGFSNPGVVKNILEEVGVREELELKRVQYGLRAFGQHMLISLPFQELATELIALYPSDEKGIRRFFDDMSWIGSASGEPYPQLNTTKHKYLEASAAEYLRDLVDDWRLRRILGSMGTREPYSSLPLLAAMWTLLCGRG